MEYEQQLFTNVAKKHRYGCPNQQFNRPLSLGGHVESQENKKLSFCRANLALNLCLAEACYAKTKLFILLRLNMAAE